MFLRINISMIILTLDEMKAIAQKRGIKSEDDLIKILDETATSLSKRKIKDI